MHKFLFSIVHQNVKKLDLDIFFHGVLLFKELVLNEFCVIHLKIWRRKMLASLRQIFGTVCKNVFFEKLYQHKVGWIFKGKPPDVMKIHQEFVKFYFMKKQSKTAFFEIWFSKNNLWDMCFWWSYSRDLGKSDGTSLYFFCVASSVEELSLFVRISFPWAEAS